MLERNSLAFDPQVMEHFQESQGFETYREVGPSSGGGSKKGKESNGGELHVVFEKECKKGMLNTDDRIRKTTKRANCEIDWVGEGNA